MKFSKNKLIFDHDESNVELKIINSRFGGEKFVDVTLRFPALEKARQLHQGSVWLRPRSTDLISLNDTEEVIQFIESRGKHGHKGYEKLLAEIEILSSIDKIRIYRIAHQHKYANFAGTRWIDELTS